MKITSIVLLFIVVFNLASLGNALVISLDPTTNFAYGPGISAGYGICGVKTSFSSIELDTSTMLINTADFSGAINTVLWSTDAANGVCPNSFNPFGTVGVCDEGTMQTSIDLRGTGFKLDDTWVIEGNIAGGSISSFDHNNQTLIINAYGSCGYSATTRALAEGEPIAIRQGGWFLKVVPVEEGAPCNDGSGCTSNDVWRNGECVGEYQCLDNECSTSTCVNGECMWTYICERLSLNPTTNFAYGPGIYSHYGVCGVKTSFASIELNTVTKLINTADFTGALNTVEWSTDAANGICPFSFNPFGTIGVCGEGTKQTSIDLRGTGFKLDDNWAIEGNIAGGSISTFDLNHQTLIINTYGSCGYTATIRALDEGEPVAIHQGGWFLKVVPVEEGAPCDDGSECTANDVWRNGECVGEFLCVDTPCRTATCINDICVRYDVCERLNLNPTTNFAYGPGISAGYGICGVKTSFSSIELDTSTMLINTADFSGAINTVVWDTTAANGVCPNSSVPFGTIGVCGEGTMQTSIDLRGTGFKIDDAWVIEGNIAGGSISSFDRNNQTLIINAYGSCGYSATTRALEEGEPIAIRQGGWFLKVVRVEEGAPCDDGSECTVNDVWQNGECIGEYLCERLTLNPTTNFAYGPGVLFGYGYCGVKTSFSSIELNPVTMLINTADFLDVANTIIWDTTAANGLCPNSFNPFGTIGVCGEGTMQTSIDLRGTGFKLDDQWAIEGNIAGGSISSLDHNNQTLIINAYGSCGYSATTRALAEGEPIAIHQGGWFLKVVPLEEGAPCDDGSECTTNDVWQNGECVGEYVCERLALNPTTNFAYGPGILSRYSYCGVKTSFSSVLLNTATLLINTADFSDSANTVVWETTAANGVCSNSSVPFGTVGVCDEGTVQTSIDLRGTGFKLDDQWVIEGNIAGGSILFDNNNQTLIINAYGSCGYSATNRALAEGEPIAIRQGGWFLKVAPLV